MRQLRGQNSVNLLADLRIWGTVVLISVLGVGTALIPYYAGKRGIEAVLTRFPRLRQERLERAEALYREHGSGLLFLSFIPMLGMLLTAGAGIAGIQLSTFVVWVLVGRILRNTVLLVLLDQGLRILLAR
jgi:membrane protein DedA with SNARE-associated domain